MTSVVQLCNLSLSHLGNEATVASIDPPESSVEAGLCATYYPVARDALLQMVQWSFNTSRATLAVHAEVPAFGWDYAYALPSECLSVISVHEPTAQDDDAPREFITETLEDGTVVVMTDTADAVCRYSRRITDSGKFPPLVVVSLSHLLASYLAGPLIKGESGRKAAADQRKDFVTAIGSAIVADRAQNRIRPQHIPDWMKGHEAGISPVDAWVTR